ncbi:MAG: hypothetical protein ACI9S9_004263, partial [Planctomycetota bacterium]
LLLSVELAGRVGEVVAAVVGHERCRAPGLPSLRIADENAAAVGGMADNSCAMARCVSLRWDRTVVVLRRFVGARA